MGDLFPQPPTSSACSQLPAPSTCISKWRLRSIADYFLVLYSLGDDVSGASLVAKRFECIRCKCEGESARGCIQGIVGKDNPEHFKVATQDPALRVIASTLPENTARALAAVCIPA